MLFRMKHLFQGTVKFSFLLTFLLSSTGVFAKNFEVKVTNERADGLYRNGEKVEFSVTVTYDGAPTSMPVRIEAKIPGTAGEKIPEAKTGPDGKASLVFAPELPGWVHVVASVVNAKNQVLAKGQAGVIYRAGDIRPGLPPPDDFRAYWDAEIAKLDKVPINARLVPCELSEKESDGGKVKGFEFTLDCVGPYPATGFIGMPVDAKPKSLPIIVAYQGATGVRAWKPWYYASVAISLTASKFGLPNQLTDDEYKAMGYNANSIYALAKAPLVKRDDNVFKWMILRDLRVQQYAKSLPEWNGKVFIVNGESLGGAQSLICGALDPDVTFISACVPALCDHNAYVAGRSNGWPNIWDKNEKDGPANDDVRQVFEAARYFDTANFTTLISTNKEVTVGVGYIDTTCPPDGVYAAFNVIPAGVEKRLSPRPLEGHGAGNMYGGKRIFEILGK